ncbi:hypothetical protein EYF80_031076 [Liparis tanakae]|uniref:Uncharacterized protein n=1 Tax=Liparis tanakae TaxID=230148 RepID=A0A4Z2H187_9TELE|nr:hypothetical protein EYF80_031076 [Liparis tanakae]
MAEGVHGKRHAVCRDQSAHRSSCSLLLSASTQSVYLLLDPSRTVRSSSLLTGQRGLPETCTAPVQDAQALVQLLLHRLSHVVVHLAGLQQLLEGPAQLVQLPPLQRPEPPALPDLLPELGQLPGLRLHQGVQSVESEKTKKVRIQRAPFVSLVLTLLFLPQLPTSVAPISGMVPPRRPLSILGGVGSELAGERVPPQETLHLEDELGLGFQLRLQLPDLSLELQRVLRNAVLVVDLQAFQTDLETDESIRGIQIAV